MTELRAVLFDLDGTLADTAPDLADALNRLRGECGRPALPESRIRPAASHGSKALIRMGFGVGEGDKDFASLRARFLAIYQDNLCRRTRLFPGFDKILAGLHRRGLRWGIVTNKPAYLTGPLVQQLGLTQAAACVVSGDSTPNSKPHPAPILRACQLLDIPPQVCLYVGDAERDIRAGKRAGMRTLIAAYGYIGDADRPETWGADATLSAPADLLDWIDAQ